MFVSPRFSVRFLCAAYNTRAGGAMFASPALQRGVGFPAIEIDSSPVGTTPSPSPEHITLVVLNSAI
jgi:hypothetical protein